jgi:hypothetical protein
MVIEKMWFKILKPTDIMVAHYLKSVNGKK